MADMEKRMTASCWLMLAEIKRATHHFWDDGCIYAGLDLPQVTGLFSEIVSNAIVGLETTKQLFRRYNVGTKKELSA